MKNQKTMGNKGFSLVELIVVIAIMAVLVGVLAPQFIRYVEKSRESTDIQNIQQIMTAVETSVADGTTTADVTITITTTKTATSIQALTDNGISSLQLKSAKWGKVQLKYSASTNKWTVYQQNAKAASGAPYHTIADEVGATNSTTEL